MVVYSRESSLRLKNFKMPITIKSMSNEEIISKKSVVL